MLLFLLVLSILTFVTWPYVVVYRLGRAVAVNDHQALARLVDLKAIRQHLQQLLDHNIDSFAERFDNLVFKFLRGGVKAVSSGAVDAIDHNWLRETVWAAQGSQTLTATPSLEALPLPALKVQPVS